MKAQDIRACQEFVLGDECQAKGFLLWVVSQKGCISLIDSKSLPASGKRVRLE